MAVSLEELAKELDLPANVLLNRSLAAYIEHELRLAEEDIADLREKYLVTDRHELERRVKERFIPSHPAWEDIITWENTEQYITRLKGYLAKIM
jgi:hypothetical protein